MVKSGLMTSVMKAIAGMSTKTAYGDYSDACALWIYRPKRPEALKKVSKRP